MTQEVTGISKTSVSYNVVIKNCKHYNYANNLKIHLYRIYYSVFSILLSYQQNNSVKNHSVLLSMTYYVKLSIQSIESVDSENVLMPF